jgi:hypothetical protein
MLRFPIDPRPAAGASSAGADDVTEICIARMAGLWWYGRQYLQFSNPISKEKGVA